MPRPSQNIDQVLLDAGMQLLPLHGCRGLAVRQVVDHAGVSLGMFHYHFKTKDLFIRTVLQRMYDQMFVQLTSRSARGGTALERLRAALRLLARFGRANAAVLSRLLADAIDGEPVAREFLQTSVPRHARIVAALLREAQAEGVVVRAPIPRLLAFLAGAVGAPIVLGAAAVRVSAGQRAAFAPLVQRHVLGDAAIAQRVDFALRGILAAGAAP